MNTTRSVLRFLSVTSFVCGGFACSESTSGVKDGVGGYGDRGGTFGTGGTTNATAGSSTTEEGGLAGAAGSIGEGGLAGAAGSIGEGGLAGAAGSIGEGGLAGAAGSIGEGGLAGAAGSIGEGSLAGAAGGTSTHADCDGLDGNYRLALAPADTTSFESSATKFTLTLASSTNGCVASIAPRFYPRTEVLAKVTDTQVEIGEKAPNADRITSALLATGWYWGLTFFDEYYWHQVVISRSGTGLGTTSTAQVSVAWAEDDISSVSRLDYVGTAALDDEAPSIEAGPAAISIPVPPPVFLQSTGGERRPGLPDQLLPWDLLEVRASEPLADLASKISLMPNAGNSVGISWTPAETKANVITDGSWLWGRFQDWDAVSGTTQNVEVAAGLKDNAGHELPAQTLAVEVLDVGVLLEQHLFDGALTVRALGTITQGEGFIVATAPCNSGIGGIAGRLLTAGRTKVKFQLDPDNSLVINVVGKSGRAYNTPTPAYVEGFSTWETAIEGESEVGFSVVPNSMCHWTTQTSVKIAKIWAE